MSRPLPFRIAVWSCWAGKRKRTAFLPSWRGSSWRTLMLAIMYVRIHFSFLTSLPSISSHPLVVKGYRHSFEDDATTTPGGIRIYLPSIWSFDWVGRWRKSIGGVNWWIEWLPTISPDQSQIKRSIKHVRKSSHSSSSVSGIAVGCPDIQPIFSRIGSMESQPIEPIVWSVVSQWPIGLFDGFLYEHRPRTSSCWTSTEQSHSDSIHMCRHPGYF